MSRHARWFIAPCAAIGALALVPSSSLAFDSEAYIDFLDSIRDQTAEELIASHEPFGPYLFSVPNAPGEPEYLDAITEHFSFTDDT